MSVEEIQEGAPVTVISKNEKKAKQQILKLGLKEIKGISRVTFKQKGNLIFAIDRPEVYKSAGGSYVVFGECQVEDMNKRYAEAQAAQEAAQAANAAGADAPASKDPASITADLEAAAANLKDASLEDEDDNEPVDETGLDPADVELIMEQANVSRSKAVKALRAHDGDMVNAIVELSQ